MMNENSISNIVVDVDFLEDEFKRNGRPELCAVFQELRLVRLQTRNTFLLQKTELHFRS